MRAGLEEAGAAKPMFADGGESATDTAQFDAEKAALERATWQKAAADMDRQDTQLEDMAFEEAAPAQSAAASSGGTKKKKQKKAASKPSKVVAL